MSIPRQVLAEPGNRSWVTTYGYVAQPNVSVVPSPVAGDRLLEVGLDVDRIQSGGHGKQRQQFDEDLDGDTG